MNPTRPRTPLALSLLAAILVGCTSQATPVVVTATPSPVPPPTPTAVPTPRPTPWQPVAPEEPCEPSESRSCEILFVLPQWSFAHWASALPRRFEDAGYHIVVASRARSVVLSCGGGNSEMDVDMALADVNVADYDAILFIGGSGCQSQWSDEEAHRIARDAVEQDIVLGAPGCASTILAHAGVLEGREASVCETDAAVKNGLDYCQVLEDLGVTCSDRSIVRDGLIITAHPRSMWFVPGVLATIAGQGE